jgi:hypothetical protein
MGDPRPAIAPEKFFFLRDPESWRKYFDATDYFQQQKAKILAEQKASVAAMRSSKEEGLTAAAQAENDFLERNKSMHDDVVFDLVTTAFTPWFQLRTIDEINVSLAASTQPFYTNGTWNADEKRVVWSDSIDVPSDDPPRAFDWPSFHFAVWDEPNDEAQRGLFNQTSLRRADLLSYCIWYQGLTAAEKQEWDEFVATLQPDEPSHQQLKSFHFKGERVDEERQSIASTGIKRLLGAFEPAEE